MATVNLLDQKKIVFVTGTRADFGKIKPLIEIARDNGADVHLYVTGMHMLREFGLTKLEVQRTPDVTIHECINQKKSDLQDTILSKTVSQFSDFVHEHHPDLVIVHGDRVEALACAIVCATNYINIAHIEGGEVSGTIDESFRHCISKLCFRHFTSSDEAKQRLRRLGENEEDIFNIGSPELDVHARESGVSLEEVKKRYEIPFSEYGICIFHPVTSEKNTIGLQAERLFSALEKTEKNYVIIKPNNDPGNDAIMTSLLRHNSNRFRVIPSMRFEYFSELLKNSYCVIGNSSLGVREAPFLGIPSINIGTRQTNRSSAQSVSNFHIENDDAKLVQLIKSSWGSFQASDRSFGEGNAAQNFLQVLHKPEFWQTDGQKVFRDHAE